MPVNDRNRMAHGVSTTASDPIAIHADRAMISKLGTSNLSNNNPPWCSLGPHLYGGDSRAAVVVSLRPLRVAAYSDELDCVAMLGFPTALLEEYPLRRGSRLVTVNMYHPSQRLAADLTLGPGDTGRYKNFHPIIADFCSRNAERIEARKLTISDQEWRRTETLGDGYIRARGLQLSRMGHPDYGHIAARVEPAAPTKDRSSGTIEVPPWVIPVAGACLIGLLGYGQDGAIGGIGGAISGGMGGAFVARFVR